METLVLLSKKNVSGQESGLQATFDVRQQPLQILNVFNKGNVSNNASLFKSASLLALSRNTEVSDVI